jgi:salicylate hydroxylase
MKICDQGVYDAFNKVVTRNQWDSKQDVWFDFLDGMKKDQSHGHQDAAFTITSSVGMNGVHRAAYLDEMVKLVEHADFAHFGKRLVDIKEGENGKLVLQFKDGTSATADAVIGCDGLKSAVRHILVGPDSPMANHVYTYKYAYRGLIDMNQAVEAIGEERAKNAVMWVSGHILFYSISRSSINMCAC